MNEADLRIFVTLLGALRTLAHRHNVEISFDYYRAGPLNRGDAKLSYVTRLRGSHPELLHNTIPKLKTGQLNFIDDTPVLSIARAVERLSVFEEEGSLAEALPDEVSA